MTSKLAAIAAALFAAACATMTVSSHMEQGLDTSAYHTFTWGTPDTLPTGDPRLDENPFFKDRVEGAIERGLAVRGIVLTETAPDLTIHYHAVITPRMDVNRIDRDYGYCFDEACSARALEYEEGTLVLDVIDARTNRLIWRGWAQKAVDAALTDRDKMAQDIDEAVRRMLARLPAALPRKQS